MKILFFTLPILLTMNACSTSQPANKVETAPQTAVNETVSEATPAVVTTKAKTNVKGLSIKVLKQGKGEAIKNFEKAKVHYTGKLTNGKVFDSSRKHNQPFEFVVGAGQVIKGWDLGVEGMKVGESRKLTIASDLAYGDQGAAGVIPPKATLIFDVELLEIVK